MRITVLSNIPSPYRIEFFNELGKLVNLTVVFEARRVRGIKFNWNDNMITNFNAVFLKDGFIEEKRINIRILKYINSKNQDYIIVTNYAYYTEMLGLLYIKLKKIPYMLEIDGGLIKKENRLKKWLKRYLISNADLYLSPSKNSDNYLEYYGAKRKGIRRYPFTSLKNKDILSNIIKSEDKEIFKSKLNMKENKIVLSVGQFIYRKGYDILLKAAVNIDKKVGIYIVGGIPTDEYVKLKNKFGLNNVHFVDFKDKDELKQYYNAADIFALPTREDVWGLVINEAMARGLPIVSTNKCVAALELVKNGQNGFIVSAEDDTELYKKIDVILNDDSLRDRMGKNSLEMIRKYTIENMAKEHFNIFNEIDKYKNITISS